MKLDFKLTKIQNFKKSLCQWVEQFFLFEMSPNTTL